MRLHRLRGRLTLALRSKARSLAGLGSLTLLAMGANLYGPLPAEASPASPTTTLANPSASAEILVDVDTGAVLFAQNDHTPLPPGSLTKMLTALVAWDWLPHDAQVPVSARDASVTPVRMGMQAGQVWPFDQVLQGMLVFSANDAAYAMAVRVSGSLAGFARTMRLAATQIGLRDHPVLEDPAGLDGNEGYRGGNLISAWDLAVTARDLMANPALASIVAERQLDFTGPDGTLYGLDNQNLYFLNTYPGAIGVKTGLTANAGFCVAEEAERQGRHMLAVVLHGYNSYESAAYLLDKGFATPVKAEAGDPKLPPVREPEPPRSGYLPPSQRQAAFGPPAAAASAAFGQDLDRTVRAKGIPGWEWAAASATAVATLVALARWRVRRRARRRSLLSRRSRPNSLGGYRGLHAGTGSQRR